MVTKTSPCTVCERPNYDAETEALEMIGQQLYFCPCHIPRTSFNSKTGWLSYQIKLSHKSTGQFLTINQPHYQQFDDPLNQPAVQNLIPGTTK